jgi:Carboxypeptidase regulatory-like domain
MVARGTAPSLSAWIPLLAVATLAAQQPRDARPPASPATALIAGSVVTRDGRPVDRAVVTIRSDALPLGRSAITDDRGTFAIDGLPPGRMTIATTKPGYLVDSYGATLPGWPGTPVVLDAGQSRSVTIAMTRGGVITGTIRDERGQPIPDLTVLAVDARPQIQQPTGPFVIPSVSPAPARTDGHGVYRLFDLYPGEYLIVAIPPAAPSSGDAERRRTAKVDAILAGLQRASGAEATVAAPEAGQSQERGEPWTLAPTFHPGTPVAREASAVRLGGGDERGGIDFAVRPVPVAAASGTVTSPNGVPSGYQLSIAPGNWIRLGGFSAVQPILLPSGDDRFTYLNLVPGRYTITARANPTMTKDRPAPGNPFGDPAANLFAVAEIDVTGADVAGIELRLRPGARLSGRVVMDPAGVPLMAVRQLALITLIAENELSVFLGGPTQIGGFRQPRLVVPDGSGDFEIAGLAPGLYRVTCQCGGGWRLQSAIVNGRDLLDTVFDATLGADLSGVVLTLTNRATELAGTLQTSAGLPAPEYFVIAFPADAALRLAGSRRVRVTRPATDGSFSFADLPPGAYFLAALTDIDPNEWQKAEFLNALVPSSVKIALGDGEKKRQDLRVAR